MIYSEVFKKFNQLKIKYIVVGGVAVVLHGYVRYTADLDIIVDPSPENIDKLFSALHELNYLPRVPVTAEEFKQEKKRREWIEQKNMKAFSFFHRKDPLKMFYILVGELPKYKKFKRVIYEADGIAIPTASISDIKRLKLKADRLKDREDIRQLAHLSKIK